MVTILRSLNLILSANITRTINKIKIKKNKKNEKEKKIYTVDKLKCKFSMELFKYDSRFTAHILCTNITVILYFHIKTCK